MSKILQEINRRVTLSSAFIIGGIISIAVSSWQYQTDGNGYNFGSTSLESLCNSFPLQYMRPFSIRAQGQSDSAYCGYSDANTGYRLFVAIVTLLFGIAFTLDLVLDNEKLLFWSLLSLSVIWIAGLVSDSTVLSNSNAACESGWTAGSGIECTGGIYGVTIAVDLILTLMASIFFVWFAVMWKEIGGHHQEPKFNALPKHGNSAVVHHDSSDETVSV